MRRASPDPRDGHCVDRAPSTAWELSIDSNRTTRAQVFHIPHHREDALRHDVASMAWVCRGRSRTGFICKARGRRAAGASTCDGLCEAAPVARGREVRLRAALRVQSLFRRAREGRRAVPESYAARGVRRDVLVERARAEGPVVTAASPTHAVRPARDAAKGRGDPAPRPLNDQMRSLDGDARLTETPSAPPARARPLDGGGAQCLVGRTRWLVARHRWL